MRKEKIETKINYQTNKINSKQTKYFFSVVICTYNRELLLPRALNSLIKQKFTDFEVIIVDDGSTDRTFSLIKEYRDKLNLRYIFQQRKGLSTARNVGGFSAEAEYITFLDSDDEYKPEHLQIRHRVLSENRNINFLYGGVEVIGNKFVPDANNPDNLVEITQCVVGGTFFIKKELFYKLKGFRELDYADDYDFYKRVLEEKSNILKIDYPSYIYYRDTEDSMCNAIIKNRRKSGKEK